MSRRPGSKDKMGRAPRGSGASERSGEMKQSFPSQVKARHASYPPLGQVHMNSGVPSPDSMDASGGMPQGEEMSNVQGGGVY